jgi:hypothetical protein
MARTIGASDSWHPASRAPQFGPKIDGVATIAAGKRSTRVRVLPLTFILVNDETKAKVWTNVTYEFLSRF